MWHHAIPGVPVILGLAIAAPSFSQTPSPGVDASRPPPAEGKRIFGLIPNYRTSPSLKDSKPLSPREKFRIASLDAFDRGTIVLGAAFGGLGQIEDSSKSFGHGVDGYARYFGTSYADFAIGDFLTEAIFPTMLRQDPRYFRLGTKGKRARTLYAMGQIFKTHSDRGTTQFNYSEILGNSAAVAVATSYYPDNRDATDALIKLGAQLGTDMAANILKEFWPDWRRHLRRRHRIGKP